jgi:hypothetical protein
MWHCWKHCRNDLLELWSVIVPENEGHIGNDTLVTVILFLERVRIHEEQNQENEEVGGPKPCF